MNRKPETAHGFTLIELMIVLVIVAILTAIALPSYTAYVQRANRAHAKAALLRDAQWMERAATAQGVYPTQLAAGLEQVEGNRYAVCLVGGTLAAGVALPAPACPAANGDALPAATATTFSLVAYRVTGAGNDTDPCGDFTLTQVGVRSVINASLSAAECWR